MTKVLLSACEPSGDALGASLMKAFHAKRPDVEFIGGGGPLMIEEGLKDALRTDSLAVMGPMDALAALPRAKKFSKQLAALAHERSPDVCILIDSWAFSKMAADAIKARAPGVKLVKLGVPQVWGSRPQRAETAAELFDLLLCLLPFEPPLFKKHGGHAIFVGNPNFQTASAQPRSGPAFRARHNISDEPLLLMLPGSRNGEIKKLLPVFKETFDEVAAKIPGLRVGLIAADAVQEKVSATASTWGHDVIIVPPNERFDAFDAGDVALAASGTVTTELALTGTPMIATYKVGAVTAYWAKKVIITPYVTVLNIAAQEEIIPERLQDQCMPSQLSADIQRLFHDEEARRRQMSAFRRLLPGLIGSENAADAAAKAVLELIDGQDSSDLDGSTAG